MRKSYSIWEYPLYLTVMLVSSVMLLVASPIVFADVIDDTDIINNTFGNKAMFGERKGSLQFSNNQAAICVRFKTHKEGNLTHIYSPVIGLDSSEAYIYDASTHDILAEINVTTEEIIGGHYVYEANEYILCEKFTGYSGGYYGVSNNVYLSTQPENYKYTDYTDYQYYANHPQEERLDYKTEGGYFLGTSSYNINMSDLNDIYFDTDIFVHYRCDIGTVACYATMSSPSYRYEDGDVNSQANWSEWADVPLGGWAGQRFTVPEDFDVYTAYVFLREKTDTNQTVFKAGIYCDNESQPFCINDDTEICPSVIQTSILDAEPTPIAFSSGCELRENHTYTLRIECHSHGNASDPCDSTYNVKLPKNYYPQIDGFSFDGLNSCYTETKNQPCSAKTGEDKYADMYFRLSSALPNGSNATSVCNSWDNPYLLREDFNNKILSNCGWTVGDWDIYHTAELTVPNTVDNFFMYKSVDTVDQSNCRYVTTEFDLLLGEHSGIVGGGYVGLTTFATSSYAMARVFFNYNDTSDGLIYYDREGGLGYLSVNGTPLNSSEVTIRITTDMINDEYAVYYNGALLGNNIPFVYDFNAESTKYVQFESTYIDFQMDNLDVYCSDSGGNTKKYTLSLPSTEDIDTDYSDRAGDNFCNLFAETPSDCTADDECDTGVCLVTGKCSTFDYTYCDDTNRERTQGCMLMGVLNCGLSGVGSWILNNFLLFLVLLLILMVFVYMSVMFGGGKK